MSDSQNGQQDSGPAVLDYANPNDQFVPQRRSLIGMAAITTAGMVVFAAVYTWVVNSSKNPVYFVHEYPIGFITTVGFYRWSAIGVVLSLVNLLERNRRKTYGWIAILAIVLCNVFLPVTGLYR